MAEQAMEKPFSSSILLENGGLESTPPIKDQKLDENPHDSGEDLRKTCMKMVEHAIEKTFNCSSHPENGGLESTPPLKDQKLDANPHDSGEDLRKTCMKMVEHAIERTFNCSSQPENGGLENTPPVQDQKLDENPQDSGKNLKKTCTPDRLRVPKAFKYPERYRSPTDSMMSPVTKGLLARNRKAGGSLLPPSINQTRIHELRVQDIDLSQN